MRTVARGGHRGKSFRKEQRKSGERKGVANKSRIVKGDIRTRLVRGKKREKGERQRQPVLQELVDFVLLSITVKAALQARNLGLSPSAPEEEGE